MTGLDIDKPFEFLETSFPKHRIPEFRVHHTSFMKAHGESVTVYGWPDWSVLWFLIAIMGLVFEKAALEMAVLKSVFEGEKESLFFFISVLGGVLGQGI